MSPESDPAHADDARPFRIRPLSARSVVLSLLLGSNPPALSGRDLVRLGERFGIAAPTLRVALSRMVTGGDLTLGDGVYTLTERHRIRQAELIERAHLRRAPYRGVWRMGVVTESGRPAEERTELRKTMLDAAFAELREGVWLRPDNLPRTSVDTRPELQFFDVTPDHADALAHQLWDLPRWAGEAREFIDRINNHTEDPLGALTAAAAAVRHLGTDPALPDELSPPEWPADALRTAYANYRTALAQSLHTPRAQPPHQLAHR